MYKIYRAITILSENSNVTKKDDSVSNYSQHTLINYSLVFKDDVTTSMEQGK